MAIHCIDCGSRDHLRWSNDCHHRGRADRAGAVAPKPRPPELGTARGEHLEVPSFVPRRGIGAPPYPRCPLCDEAYREDMKPPCKCLGEDAAIPSEVWRRGRDAPKATVTVAEGRKDDGGKIRMELIPPELLEAVGDILTFGAVKYEDRNWEKGMAWSRPFGALMRHMWAWWRGEKADAETGKSHLWHAACCLAFLVAYEARGTGKDDRP